MEISDPSIRSVLKKSDTIINKDRRVTFCNTVKVFIDDLNKNKNADLPLKCMVVSIVDKSSDCLSENNDDCSASDFLVHKVVYESDIEQDECDIDSLSEGSEETSILFSCNNDEENLEFFVHKITEHEDDLLQKELEYENSDSTKNNVISELESDLVGKLSELSIENILAHDKIIAFIDQKNLGLPVHSESLQNANNSDFIKRTENEVESSSNSFLEHVEDLILSPPLQELSIDKIVKAQSNNTLSELDISPLNSIQETDSESDVSSEGTMIMMTSEESEKNERHIRESLMQYESLKKEKDKNNQLQTESVSYNCDMVLKKSEMQKSSLEQSDESKSCNLICSQCCDKMDEPIGAMLLNDSGDKILCTEESIDDSSVIALNSDSCTYFETSRHKTFDLKPDEKAPAYTSDEAKKYYGILNNCFDKSLESVEIPKDVREWKILINSYEEFPRSNSVNYSKTVHQPVFHVSEFTSPEPNTFVSDSNPNLTKSDELESFVHESIERIQRIRRRYRGKDHHTRYSSVRGIKPRFKSTAEILRLMQEQSKPPLLTYNGRSHISWPFNEVTHSENIADHRETAHAFGSGSLSTDSSSQSSFISLFSEDSSSSSCDYDSVSSCPSMFFQERGVPEGASPPRSLSDDASIQYAEEDSSIVYFSMRV